MLIDIKIPLDKRRLLGQLGSRTTQLQDYSLFLVLWLSHSRSFFNSAKVIGKIGRTMRNLRTTAEERLISKRSRAQASAHHPQPHSRLSIIRTSRNTTTITRAPAKNTAVLMKRRTRTSKCTPVSLDSRPIRRSLSSK